MSAKRRRRVSKLLISIKPLSKEDRKKAKVMEEFINYQILKGLSKIEKRIQNEVRNLLLGRIE